MVPFSPSWDPKKQKEVELDAQSLEYIQTMSKIIDQRSKLVSSFFLKKGLLILYLSLPHQKLNCLHCARNGVIIIVHDHWFGWSSCSSIDK